MRLPGRIVLIAACILASAGGAGALNRSSPQDYGKVVIGNYSRPAGIAPVVFDHWLHRARFTCRLCHVDIGFAMEEGATNITAAMNKKGVYCGTCHNGVRQYDGKAIFAACSEGARDARCERCHSLDKKVRREYEFNTFSERLPRRVLGNGIDWEEAESRGLIKPIDFLEGVSMQGMSVKPQEDFSIEAKAGWMPDVLFSHRKHAVWNGCEVCHPDIFPVKKGGMKYTMLQINGGAYCGACHDKVAFSLLDCQRCHLGGMGK